MSSKGWFKHLFFFSQKQATERLTFSRVSFNGLLQILLHRQILSFYFIFLNVFLIVVMVDPLLLKAMVNITGVLLVVSSHGPRDPLHIVFVSIVTLQQA